MEIVRPFLTVIVVSFQGEVALAEPNLDKALATLSGHLTEALSQHGVGGELRLTAANAYTNQVVAAQPPPGPRTEDEIGR